MPVVCATNFTPQAAQAAQVAARLAARRATPLWLVHVAEGSGASEGDARLQAEGQRLAQLGARVHEVLLRGAPHEVLLRFVQDKGASHLIVGAPHQPPKRLRLGGSLERLVQLSPVPLMLVREAAPFEAWVSGSRPLGVVLGVDRSAASEAARDWVAHLAQFGPLELTVAHVFWAPDEYERLGIARPLHLKQEVTPDLLRHLEHEVASWMEGAAVQPSRVRLVPGLGRPVDYLLHVMAEQQAEVLVLGTHRRRGVGRLWSTSHHALRLAHGSVVLVPAEARPVEHEPVLPGYRRVLVGTDFSPLGNRAIPQACTLAAPGGDVYLVHVGPARAPAQDEAQRLARLRALVPPEAERHGKHCHVEVLSGADVAAALVHAAEQLDVDALCFASCSRGRGPLSSGVLGPVVQKALELTHRPVLLVRAPADP